MPPLIAVCFHSRSNGCGQFVQASIRRILARKNPRGRSVQRTRRPTKRGAPTRCSTYSRGTRGHSGVRRRRPSWTPPIDRSGGPPQRHLSSRGLLRAHRHCRRRCSPKPFRGCLNLKSDRIPCDFRLTVSDSMSWTSTNVSILSDVIIGHSFRRTFCSVK